MSEKPLLTLAVCCYKFERFIHEAVEAALAQTYRPLEIVISDDCSPDASWDRIVETVERLYPANSVAREVNEQRLILEDGLTLVLNRNPRNLGLALHENRLFELSSGEWIAFQSGDDISAPDRMMRIAEEVIKEPKIRGLYSKIKLKYLETDNASITETDVENIQNRKSRRDKALPYFLGASAVYHRDVYLKFGPLGATVSNEDQVLPLRAILLGEIVKIETPLVLYRKHSSNLSGTDFDNDPHKAALNRLKLIFARYQTLIDLQTAEKCGFDTCKRIKKYRCLAEEDIVVQRFLANLTLSRRNKVFLLLGLLLPRNFSCFAARFLRRCF